MQITKRDGSDLPGEDREERNLGKLGFGGELRADLGKGAHVIDVGVRGPDWEEGTIVDFAVAEGDSITVTIELVPSCECDD